MLASTENKLRYNGFSLRKEKNEASVRGNEDATHHNNHQEGFCLPAEASATTVASETLRSLRGAGTQPHPFTSSITQTSAAQLYFLIPMTNN